MARPALSPEQRAAADARQRSGVLGGLAVCIAKNGYAATTISQIAAEAKVSNSTVYNHFADKEAVLVALYDGLIDQLVDTIERADTEAAESGLVGVERIRAGVHRYVSLMVGGGALTRAMLIEVPAVSPQLFAARQRGRRRYVELLERLQRDVRPDEEQTEAAGMLLVAAIGGMNELLLGAFDDASPRTVSEITHDATTLLGALLLVPPGGGAIAPWAPGTDEPSSQ